MEFVCWLGLLRSGLSPTDEVSERARISFATTATSPWLSDCEKWIRAVQAGEGTPPDAWLDVMRVYTAAPRRVVPGLSPVSWGFLPVWSNGPAVEPASPRLEAIRHHLKADIQYATLVDEIGREDVDLGDALPCPVYLLDGKHKGCWLLLEFDGDRLRSARIVDPQQHGRVIELILN
jgi:hypothetical protein